MRNQLAIAVSVLVIVLPAFSSALTLADLQAQLRFVSSQLKALYSLDGSVAVAAAGAATSAPECPILTRELKRGDSDATSGGEVSRLQDFLIKKHEIAANAFAETPKGYFGHLTQVALESWQTRNNLLATGKTDAVTRTSIAACKETALAEPVILLSVDKEYVYAGEEVNLSWKTQHTTQCSLTIQPDGGIPTETTVGLNATVPLRADVSTTVTVTCANNIGLETKGPVASEHIRMVVQEALTSDDITKLSQASAALAALESTLLQMLGR